MCGVLCHAMYRTWTREPCAAGSAKNRPARQRGELQNAPIAPNPAPIRAGGLLKQILLVHVILDKQTNRAPFCCYPKIFPKTHPAKNGTLCSKNCIHRFRPNRPGASHWSTKGFVLNDRYGHFNHALYHAVQWAHTVQGFAKLLSQVPRAAIVGQEYTWHVCGAWRE